MNESSYSNLVRALVRSLKAVGFYKADHPTLVQMHGEVLNAMRAIGDGKSGVTLASCGPKLLVKQGEPPLAGTSAKALAEHLFKRRIVCLRLSPKVTAAQLSSLYVVLAEAPETLKANGGAGARLKDNAGVQVVEIDFEALFAGQVSELSVPDPLGQYAVRELLRLHNQKSRVGNALNVSLEHVNSAASLGSLLESLLQSAAPGVVTRRLGPQEGGARPANAMPELGQLSTEDLAELVGQSYTHVVSQMSLAGANEAALSEAAKVLSKAMIRITPEGRFSVLRNLAAPAASGAQASADALMSLTRELSQELIVQTLGDSLRGQALDSEAVSSVCAVIRSLKPIDSERRALVQAIDAYLRRERAAPDGALWQEILAGTLGDRELGVLQLRLQPAAQGLVACFNARQKAEYNPAPIAALIETLSPAVRAARAAEVLGMVVQNAPEMSEPLKQAVREAVEARSADRAMGKPVVELLAILCERGDKKGVRSSQAMLARQLLSGQKGALRAIQIAQSGRLPGSMMVAEALLAGFDMPLQTEERKELQEVFTALPASTLHSLKARASDASGSAVHHLVQALVRANPTGAVDFARSVLRHRDVRVKESILKALAGAGEHAVALLAVIAGCDTDETSRSALGLEASNDEQPLLGLQRTAMQALGLTRAEAAVRALDQLLNRKKVIGGRTYDSLRADAALGLSIHGTPAARAVLTEGKKSSHKPIREACERARGGGT